MNRRNLSIFSSDKAKLVIGFFISVIVFFAYVLMILPQYNGGYNSSILDKAARLEKINEPKIVLIGNSNLAFGIDSGMIEQELGMPVVNMGLYAWLGNEFHENMSKININKGDIYVLCHSTYDDSFDTDTCDYAMQWSVIEDHFQLWRLAGLNHIEDMIYAFPIYLKKALILYAKGKGNVEDSEMYSRYAFNIYGDNVYPRNELKFSLEGEGCHPSYIGEKTVKRINNLNRYFKERGAYMVIAGYPILNTDLTSDALEYEAFTYELGTKVDCPVISEFSDYMYDPQLFYDTYLHLNDKGVELRTQQLIDDLKNWMQSSSY